MQPMFFAGEDGGGARRHVIDHVGVFGGDADQHQALRGWGSGVRRVGGQNMLDGSCQFTIASDIFYQR